MKNLPNINLSLDEYFNITENRVFTDTGSESIICATDKVNTLYKFFVNPYTRQLIDMPDNKYKKIMTIYQKDLEYSVKVLSTISANGYLVGYEMSYNHKHIPFLSLDLSSTQIISFLERVKQGLDYYASQDIVYGDIKGNNILIDLKSGEVTFCDMDNIQIGDYPIDIKGPTLLHFLKEYGTIDSVADIYMHNLFTLKRLGFPTYDPPYLEIITTLENGIYPNIVDDDGKRVLESMRAPKSFTKEYVIQYIKK